MPLTKLIQTLLLAFVAVHQPSLTGQLESNAYASIRVPQPAPNRIRPNVPSRPQTDEAAQLLDQADKLADANKLSEAIALGERAVALRSKTVKEEHPMFAEALYRLGYLYKLKLDSKRAAELYEQALKIQEKALGPEHAEVADTLNSLALVVEENGDRKRAEELLFRAMSINEKTHGPISKEVAANRNNLGTLYYRRDDLEKSLSNFNKAIEIKEKLSGPDDISLATPVANVALIYERMGNYAQAEMFHQRALQIREKKHGPKHQDVVLSLNNLATLYHALGEYKRAASMLARAATVSEELQGPETRALAALFHNLGVVYSTQGELGRAKLSLERSLAIKEKIFRPDHLSIASTLNSLALVYKRLGNLDEAERLYNKALAIQEKQSEPTPAVISTTLHNLAGLHLTNGQLDKAEISLKRAREIMESKLGADNPDIAALLETLSQLRDLQGKHSEADEASNRALQIREKRFGKMHPLVAESLQNLAYRYDVQRKYERAEPLYKRAIEIQEKMLGSASPLLSATLTNLALHYWERGNEEAAVGLLSRAGDVKEQSLALSLIVGSEAQKSMLLSRHQESTNAAVSLSAAFRNSRADATQLGMAAVLRHKGRLLDAVTETYQSFQQRLGKDEQAVLHLHKLRDTYARLANLALAGPGKMSMDDYRASIAQLEQQVEPLQEAISKLSADFNQQARPVTIELVRQALPPRTALVEFFVYQPFDVNAKRQDPSRYVAYVLRKQGPPLWVDLGEAGKIDAGITELLLALRCPQTVDDIKECPSIPEIKGRSRAVDEQVLRPVRRLLGKTRHIFLSPDGTLNLLPFAALVDENHKYMVESYTLTYLTSGRDLLRMQLSSESKQPPLIVADPAFGNARQVGASPTKLGTAPARRSADLIEVNFKQLSGTAKEAGTLAALLHLAEDRVLTQAKATEAAIKNVSRPEVLHVATHGFFLPDQPVEPVADPRSIDLGSRRDGPRVLVRSENPLLRSGLALSGANLLPSTDDGNDGILTALETTGLDLWGTKLVVLSACETGVGQVRNGEGVYGLRRALVLAGSESQVMSLWQVSDDGTRDLMVEYYKRLLAGEGRTKALRQVQLQMLRSQPQKGQPGPAMKVDYRHPYYWATFIQSGDWRSLNRQVPR